MKKKNFKEVRRALLITAFLTMSGSFFAQHCDSINNHLAGWCHLQPTDVIQLGDGNLLCRTLLITLDEDGMYVYDENHNVVSQGQMYYWINYDELTVNDSLFVPSDDIAYHLWARLHPNDNTPQQLCNLDASVIKGEDNASYLNITFFDDQLNFNAEVEVTVPLADDEVKISRSGSWLLDSNNDIILQYIIPSKEETHFARFGLDGTLKYEKVFYGSEMPYCTVTKGYGWHPQGLSQSSNNPLRYNYYGKLTQSSGIHVIAYELDASFDILNNYDLVNEWGNYPATSENGNTNGMVSCDDGGALIVRDTEWGTGNDKSTGVLKYDKDGNIEKEVWFNPFNNKLSYCSDLTKDSQGNIYLTLFKSNYGGMQVAVIKMDQDLNVVWEYSGMNFDNEDIEDSYRFPTSTAFLNDETIAVIGKNYKYPTLVTGMFLKLLNKEKANSGISETGNSLRPYLCYPNPVEDRLTVHYSPDVKPLRVELLDMQGRLLGTQKGALESIDMQSLPAGTYTMRLVLDNGKTYSDKIIKQ